MASPHNESGENQGYNSGPGGDHHRNSIPAIGTGTLIDNTTNTSQTVTGVNPITWVAGNYTLNDNQTSEVIIGGSGNNVVNEYGANASITLGNGNNVVHDSAGGTTVVTGNGDQNIELGGTGNKVTVGNTLGTATDKTSIDAGSGGATVTAGDGNVHVSATGANNNITVGTGNDVVNLGHYEGSEHGVATTAPITTDTVHLGNGTNQVFLGGSGNTIYDGTGTDTIQGAAAGNNTFVINAGGGNVNINGFSLTNGDKLDLSSILSGTGATLATLGTFVTVASQTDATHSSWTDTVLTVAGTGGTAHVTLLNTGATPLSLTSFSASNIVP